VEVSENIGSLLRTLLFRANNVSYLDNESISTHVAVASGIEQEAEQILESNKVEAEVASRDAEERVERTREVTVETQNV